MREECVRSRHWLCVVGAGSNAELEDVGKSILAALNEQNYDKPVVVVLAVASTNRDYYEQGKGGGAIILFNKIAGENLTLALIDSADAEFHISQNDVHNLPEHERNNFKSKKNGFSVCHGGKKLTKLSRRCSTDNCNLSNCGSSVTRLCLPRVGGYFRLRTQLSLVEVLMRKLSLEKYTVITLGGRLIREGITPKTQLHTLAPEKMFCLYPRRAFESRTVVALTQTMGRLCGTRSDGILPTLYIRDDCLEMFRKVIEFNDIAIHYVNKYQRGRTVQYILSRYLEEEDHPANPIIKGVCSTSFVFDSLPQCIMEMRKWFSMNDATPQSPIEFSFERKRILALMLLQLEDDLVVVDQMGEWSFESTFHQAVKTEIRSILLCLACLTSALGWIDTSSSDETSKFPVGIRRFKDCVISQSIGIRLNEIGCQNEGIRNGLVYCTCNSICQEFVSDAQFTQCTHCLLNCHNVCQPCVVKDKRLVCSRCLLSPQNDTTPSEQDSNLEDDTDNMDDTESGSDDEPCTKVCGTSKRKRSNPFDIKMEI